MKQERNDPGYDESNGKESCAFLGHDSPSDPCLLRYINYTSHVNGYLNWELHDQREYNGGTMAIQQALDRFRMDRNFMNHVSAWEVLPARPASYAPFPPALDDEGLLHD